MKARVIRSSDIAACPHAIMVPKHYREDGRCRCDDPSHTVMIEWGYSWVASMSDGAAGWWA